METQKAFQERSYERHANDFNEYRRGGIKEATARSWLKTNTVDSWRHYRMYSSLDPLLEHEKHSKWLTVGDGRYGRDARYILDRGHYALPTDISDTLLSEAKREGYISEYRVENSEALSFTDSEFDYAFCKEAYHHFPRPMLALYEMLRVARKGAILIEPNDAEIHSTISAVIFKNLKRAIKSLIGKNASKHEFEQSGNYVFRLSRREVEKVALGLNYPVVAFKGINDAFFDGVEFEDITLNGPLGKKVRLLVGTLNFLCRLNLIDYGLLAAIIFKDTPPDTLIDSLRANGYKVIRLPENPFISTVP